MMRKLTVYIIGAALVSLSFMTTPAYADCAAEIEKLEVRISVLGTMGSLRQNIENKIIKAKKFLEKGKKKKCLKLAKKAGNLMDSKGK